MLTDLTAAELAGKVRAKEVSTLEVAQAYLNRINEHDDKLGCYLTVDEEALMEAARMAEEKVNSGETGPLTGVPIAVKDNISTRNIRTTAGSKILSDYVPAFDASAMLRLKAAGCILLGKTNLDEFAMGTSTEYSAFHPTRNPWDMSRSPGGSSGGSAAAVAAQLAPIALGSDTGGSIRQPAALCGVVGFKPTYGRVSRFGLIAFGSSLDQIGPLAKTVEDAALLTQVISGADPADSTCLEMPPTRVGHLKDGSLKGLRIALPKEMFAESNDAGVMAAIHDSIEKLSREGAKFKEISLPSIAYGVTTYYIIAPAEAASNLARYDGVRFGLRAQSSGHIGMVEETRAQGFGHEVKARIMIGAYALSAGYYDAYYLRAQQVRALMRNEFNKALEDYDVIMGPTSPVPAFKLGELKKDPFAMKLLDYCTIPANLVGNPALSLNCGFSVSNGTKLPVGLQMFGKTLGDEDLLQTAYCVEQVLGATGAAPIS